MPGHGVAVGGLEMNMRLPDGKHPVSVLAGPYGHPVHPILVTLPIGVWVASVLFDLIGYAADDPAPFTTGARWLIAIGLVGALVAAFFGVLDLLAIPRRTRAASVAITHLVLNVIVTIVFALSLGLRVGESGSTDTPALLLSIAGLVLLAISGYLGGKLAYGYGVRVAAEADQAVGYATRSQSAGQPTAPARAVGSEPL
jgi:uncharacterized membrane protein